MDGTVLLSDVKSSDQDRISSGNAWDVLFGLEILKEEKKRRSYSEIVLTAADLLHLDPALVGVIGAVKGSVNLIGGAPGAGKSTMSIEMAVGYAKSTGRETMYLATEEQLSQIKSRADRLGLDFQDKVRMVEAMKGESPPLEDLISRYKPSAVFLDSLNGMAGDDKLLQIAICKSFKICCSKEQSVGIVLSHVNKGGEIAGLEGLQHEVDATFTFFPDEGEDETPRVLHVEKNRNGRAFISLSFRMTEKGLELLLDEEPEYEGAEED